MRLSLLVSCLIFTLNSWSQNFTAEQFPQNILHDIIGAECGAGVSFYDFNKDGWDDLSFAQVDGSPLFYINNNGVFEDTVLIDDYFVEGKSVLWADVDNDGDADLLLTDKFGPSRIYENTGDLNFEDRSETSGIFQTGDYETYAGSWGDFNKDGFLDLYICNYALGGTINYLYLNNGDFTFTDITEETDTGGGSKPSFQAVWIDLNDDSWLDLYVINDRFSYENLLFLNDGEGGFEEVGSDWDLDIFTDAMTNSFADYDGDWDFDLFITNSANNNMLLRNDENVYTDVTFDAAVDIQYLSWAGQWMDFENDMWLDLHVSTSQVGSSDGQNFAFHNNTDGTFETVNDIFPFNTTYQFCTSIGDYNNDGFVDLVGNNELSDFATLYKNTGDNGNNFIKVSLEGVLSNKDGIGSKIEVFSNGFGQKRFTFCGEDYMGQDSQRLIFGLGNNELVDSLIVTWPSGHIDFFTDLEINQTYHILEGSSIIIDIASNQPTSFCLGDSTVLEFNSELANLTWNTEDITDSITVYEEGWYWVNGTTELGLTITSDSIEVIVNDPPSIDVTTENINCYNDSTGSIILNNLSETGLETVTWSNDSTGLELSNLNAGIYNYNFTDTLNCSSSGSVELTQLDSISIEYFTDSTSCFEICDGAVEFLEISGGAESYILPEDTIDLCSGEYVMTIEDTLGCIKEIQFFIHSPDPLEIELDVDQITIEELGQAEVNVSGGTPPYSIVWNDEIEGSQFSDLEPGNYDLVVSDANLCSVDTVFEITTNIEEWKISNVTIFPNPAHDVLQVEWLNQKFDLHLYSATGQLIFSEKCMSKKTLDIHFLTPGYYSLLIENDSQIFRQQVLIH